MEGNAASCILASQSFECAAAAAAALLSACPVTTRWSLGLLHASLSHSAFVAILISWAAERRMSQRHCAIQALPWSQRQPRASWRGDEVSLRRNFGRGQGAGAGVCVVGVGVRRNPWSPPGREKYPPARNAWTRPAQDETLTPNRCRL